MEAHSVQNHDNKIAPQVNFNSTAANIMDLLCIFVITEQYFFQHVFQRYWLYISGICRWTDSFISEY